MAWALSAAAGVTAFYTLWAMLTYRMSPWLALPLYCAACAMAGGLIILGIASTNW